MPKRYGLPLMLTIANPHGTANVATNVRPPAARCKKRSRLDPRPKHRAERMAKQ